MALIGISGGLNLAIIFILSLASLFGFIEGWNLLTLFLAFVILIFFYFLIAKFINILKKKAGVEEMASAGKNIKIASEIGKIQRENL